MRGVFTVQPLLPPPLPSSRVASNRNLTEREVLTLTHLRPFLWFVLAII